MVTSENGIIHTYMRCMYVHLQSCTYISDVSKRGVLGSADDDIAFFLHILSILVIMQFFAVHENVFLANTCIFYIFIIRYCIFLHIMPLFIVHGKICLILFAIYMHVLHICSTWKRRDGRKCAKHFGVLRVSGLNKQSQNAVPDFLRDFRTK